MHVGMGTFFQNLDQASSDVEVYKHELALADQAEALGFDSVWAAEHHFTDYIMCPNVAQFLTYVAARTRRVRLGSMVMVLPWHDPVRVAEQFSVLDHMSGGRAILGIGRGLGRVEFEGFRVAMGESRKRFVEYAEAILTALETGYIEYDGEFYKQPKAAIRPFPFKSFRGRAYASAISPASAQIMARLGVGILIIAQKPWDKTIADLEQYRTLYRGINGQDPPRPIIASFIAVHEDEQRAKEMHNNYILRYCRSTLDHYEFDNAGLADIEGYEYYGKLAENIAKHGKDRFSGFLSDLQVSGTPDQVTEQLVDINKRIDGAGMIGVFSYGNMPADVAESNMRLFAGKVLPRLQQSGGDPLAVGEARTGKAALTA